MSTQNILVRVAVRASEAAATNLERRSLQLFYHWYYSTHLSEVLASSQPAKMIT